MNTADSNLHTYFHKKINNDLRNISENHNVRNNFSGNINKGSVDTSNNRDGDFLKNSK